MRDSRRKSKISRRTFLKAAAAASLAVMLPTPKPVEAAGVVTARSVFLPGTQVPIAFDYYISTTGNNNNDGLTPATAWNISCLIGTAHTSYVARIGVIRGLIAGKWVGLSDGTYDISGLTDSWFSGTDPVLQPPSGSSGSPTRIQAVNRQQAIIDGIDPSARTKNTCAIGQGPGGNTASNARTGNVTIDGLRIRNTGRLGGTGSSNAVSFIYSSTKQPGVRVQNCWVHDHRGVTGNNIAALAFQNCDAYYTSNNLVHDIYGTSTSDHEGYAVWHWTCSNDSVNEYLTSFNCAVGVYCKQVSHGPCIVRYCMIEAPSSRECLRGGLSVSAGAQFRVHNCILIGAQIWDGENYTNPVVENLIFYNNTCYYSGAWASGAGGAISVGFSSFNSGTVTHFNNIYQAASGTAFMFRDFASFALSNYNTVMTGNSWGVAPSGSLVTRTLAQWQSASGTLDANSNARDPLLVGPTSGDANSFKLQAGSSEIGAGRSDGTAGGAVCDRGAWGNGATRIGFSLAA